jgi:UDP-2,3-diacylglucosamine pyrophosphatase LpxH
MHFRSVFISDVHLGLRDCQARYLLDFLGSMTCECLYLVGDIIDFENMEKKPWWHADHAAVVARILTIAQGGTRVTYIPGNHDAVLRRFCDTRIAGVDISLEAIHVAADGRRYRVTHGDEFDTQQPAPEWLLAIGDVLQRFICAVNRWTNRILQSAGLNYWPLSIAIKRRISRTRKFIDDFSLIVAESAVKHRVDGHICGHIHYGDIRERGGALYLNDGDWVEHCTALVEHANGAFELLHWTERTRCLATSPAALPRPLRAVA